MGLIKRGATKIEKPSFDSLNDLGSRSSLRSSLELIKFNEKVRKRDSDEEDDPPVQLQDFKN